MTQQIQGPFKAMFDTESGWQVLGFDMQIMATIGYDDLESGDLCEEDAKRIAACLNACDGMATTVMECMPYPLSKLLAQDFQGVVAERDQLLAAAQHILAILQHPTRSVNIFDQEKLEEAVAKITTTAPHYTSISKGGTYTKLGAIRGAGSIKGLAGIAYQNEKGDLFIREPECFAKRMVLVEKQGGAQ